MLNGLSLFTGIGGLDVALFDWVRPIAYCEIDSYCQGVLLSRMADGVIPIAPIWDDITSFEGRIFNGIVEIIYGGFPCQDISIAGNGKGLAGERSGLFFEIMRLAKEIKPKFIFLENVPAITSRGGLRVIREITEMGFDCRWCVISAASVGALHKRERWFLLAHASSKRLEGFGERTSGTSEKESLPSGGRNDGNSDIQPSEQTNTTTESVKTERGTRGRPTGQCWPFESREHWQETVSRVCRTSDGVYFQLERLRSLGNAVVPQQAKEAFKILMGLK